MSARRKRKERPAGPLPGLMNVVDFPTGEHRVKLRTTNEAIRRRWCNLDRANRSFWVMMYDDMAGPGRREILAAFEVLDVTIENLYQRLARAGYLRD